MLTGKRGEKSHLQTAHWQYVQENTAILGVMDHLQLCFHYHGTPLHY